METRKHSKTMGESLKNRVCEKNKNIDPKSILERILRSFYGPFAVFLGPGVELDWFFWKSKICSKKSHAGIRGYTRVYASRIGFWGGRPFKLSQKKTPKPKSQRPKSKGQKPKEQRNDRKGNRSRSRPRKPGGGYT